MRLRKPLFLDLLGSPQCRNIGRSPPCQRSPQETKGILLKSKKFVNEAFARAWIEHHLFF
jgi:hypothetical protein